MRRRCKRMMKMEHYLDNAATTKPCAKAAAAAMRCLMEVYGNPSSLHRKGLEAQHEMDLARKRIAEALGCKSKELLFTSGATESNNLSIRGIAASYGKRRKKIIASAVEHASVKQTLSFLEVQGFTVVLVMPREDGTYHAADFLKEVDSNTLLVTMMLVNNENGCRLPVEEVFRAVKRRDSEVVTHCDAVQGFLKMPFRAKTLCADLISISAHKVHGIKGVGALYIRQGIHVKPILFGGHQEHQLRPGTESVPLIVAFGVAVEKLSSDVMDRYQQIVQLRKRLIELLRTMDGVLIRDLPDTSPYVLNISLLGYRSEIVLHYLEKQKIYLSSGSACSKGASSGVLESFGAKQNEVDSALRISFCAENTEADLTALVQGLKGAQRDLMH